MPRRSLESIHVAYEREGVKGLETIVATVPPSSAWLDTLVGGVADVRFEVPASWMLRAYLERGEELTRVQTARLLRSLARLESDDARLHLCQTVGLLDIPSRNAEQLARFLRAGVEGEHKFTRAWATDAFHRLAQQHPRYRREARSVLERAQRDPAASVRARARRIRD